MVNLSFILSILIWLPIIMGLMLLFVNDEHTDCKSKNLLCQIFALTGHFTCFLLTCVLLSKFNTSTWKMQFVEEWIWIDRLSIKYKLGIDGISLLLLVLTTLIGFIAALVKPAAIKNNYARYLAIFLIMQGLVCGVFAALDVILFYLFWEAMLIPMFLIIGMYGGKNRIYAAIKFFLYTFLGSIFLLVALLYLHKMMVLQGQGLQSFDLLSLYNLKLPIVTQQWLFWGFLVAFAVKVPMWPVHTWLPDAHTEAPTGGSVILAAILLKMGGYGFIRFILPITPNAAELFAPILIICSLIAIIYIGLIALVQHDMKKLIAYSSISHMGIVTLGFFIIFMLLRTQNGQSAEMALEGACMQMISHGFISAALFLCVGVLYEQMHTRIIQEYGGVAQKMPVFAAFFMVFAMSNAGLPGTSGFIGEFLVIITSLQANYIYGILSALTLILGAAYTLWMYKRVMLGEMREHKVMSLQDIGWVDKFKFTILTLCIVGLGLKPGPVFDVMHASTKHLTQDIILPKLKSQTLTRAN